MPVLLLSGLHQEEQASAAASSSSPPQHLLVFTLIPLWRLRRWTVEEAWVGWGDCVFSHFSAE